MHWLQELSTDSSAAMGSSPAHPLKKTRGRRMPPSCFWYGRQDLNLHGNPLEPKSNVSANSTTPACYVAILQRSGGKIKGYFISKNSAGRHLPAGAFFFIRRSPGGSGFASARNPGTYRSDLSLLSNPALRHSWQDLRSRQPDRRDGGR